MQDTHKTNTQQIDELRDLRQRNAELEAIVSNLQKSEKRFRTIANYTVDWQCWIGTDGKLMWVNQAVEKFTGYSVEEYLNLPDRLNQIIWDGDRDRILDHYENGLQKHQVENDVEFQIRRKDGSFKWVSVSYQPMYTETGEYLGMRSSIRDISTRKHTEKLLAETKEFLDNIFDNALDCIVVTDNQGYVTRVNKYFTDMLGYREDEIRGKLPTEGYPKGPGSYQSVTGETVVLDEEFFNNGRKMYKQLMEQGHVANWKSYAIKTDGKVIPVTQNIVLLYNKQQEMIGSVAIIRDDTEKIKIENQLQRSHETLTALINVAPESLFMIDADGTVLTANETLAKRLGTTVDELVGSNIYNYLPDDLGALRRNFLAQALRDRKMTYYEDARKAWYMANYIYPFSDSNGEATRAAVFSWDITERKQQEAALRESEERFRAVAESTPDAIFITDGSGKVLYSNKSAERIYGYTAEELMGNSIEILEPERFRANSSKNRERLVKEGPSHYLGETIEGIAVRKGGIEFPGEISISFWKIDDQPFFSGIVRDITERKRAENLLLQEIKFSDTLINSLPGVFYLVDDQQKFIRWNKPLEAITEYSAKELQNLNALALIHEDDRALSARKIKEVFVNGQAETEARLLSKHGKISHYFFTGRRLEIEGKSYLTGVGIDITDLKKMEQELQKSHDKLEKKVKQRTAELAKANKQLQISKDYLKKYSGKLLSVREEERKNISTTLHDELGSMAVSVGSKISIAKEEVKDNNAMAALKSLIQGESVLRKAVQDLRRLAVDLRPPNLEVMGLSGALRDYIEAIKKQSKISITFRNDLGTKKIPEAIAIVIYRVAQEALTNITKHSKAKKVRVRLYADNKTIKFNISDDGKGFDIDKIYTGKGRLKIGIEGMRERVESMGGECSITSAPKRGTQIEVTIPQ